MDGANMLFTFSVCQVMAPVSSFFDQKISRAMRRFLFESTGIRIYALLFLYLLGLVSKKNMLISHHDGTTFQSCNAVR